MKRTLMIACVAIAGIGAIAATIAAAWPHDTHAGSHGAVHTPLTADQDAAPPSTMTSADHACPYTAPPAAATTSSCCGEPASDAAAMDGACGDH